MKKDLKIILPLKNSKTKQLNLCLVVLQPTKILKLASVGCQSTVTYGNDIHSNQIADTKVKHHAKSHWIFLFYILDRPSEMS